MNIQTQQARSKNNTISFAKLIQAICFLLMVSNVVPAFAAEENTTEPVETTMNRAIIINNEGVAALKSNDVNSAIGKFRLALATEPACKLALRNLSVAYNNEGIACTTDAKKAMAAFHMACWLDPDNVLAQRNLNNLIEDSGKKADSFYDRIVLADNAKASGDFAGAIVEYNSALKMKNDPELRERMLAVQIPDDWQTVDECVNNKVAEKNEVVVPLNSSKETLTQASKQSSTQNASQPSSQPAAFSPKQETDHISVNNTVNLQPYLKDMEHRLSSAWSGARPQASGQTVVEFTLHANGQVSDVKVTKSSGVKAVDESAVEAVTKASLAPLPEGAPKELDVNFTFHLNVWS
jgi:TonB family protein